MVKYFISFFVSLILIFSCKEKQDNKLNIRQITNEYYKAYIDQKDYDNFLSFYDDTIVLEDIINGDKVIGKKSFKSFFDWRNPDLTRVESAALVIEEQIIEGNKVVTKGYFTPIKWKDTTFEPMQFTTILIFNENGKIIRHIDWLNYPNNLIDYSNRKNSNDWIKHP